MNVCKIVTPMDYFKIIENVYQNAIQMVEFYKNGTPLLKKLTTVLRVLHHLCLSTSFLEEDHNGWQAKIEHLVQAVQGTDAKNAAAIFWAPDDPSLHECLVTLHCGQKHLISLQNIAKACNIDLEIDQKKEDVEENNALQNETSIFLYVTLYPMSFAMCKELQKYLKTLSYYESKKVLARAVIDGKVSCKIPLQTLLTSSQTSTVAWKEMLATNDNWTDSTLFLLLSNDATMLNMLLEAWPYESQYVEEHQKKLKLYRSLLLSKFTLVYPRLVFKMAAKHRDYLKILIFEWSKRNTQLFLTSLYAYNLVMLQMLQQVFKNNRTFVQFIFFQCALDVDDECEFVAMVDYLLSLPQNGFFSTFPNLSRHEMLATLQIDTNHPNKIKVEQSKALVICILTPKKQTHFPCTHPKHLA